MQAKPKIKLQDSDFLDLFVLRWKLANHFQHDVLHAPFSTFDRLVTGLTLQQTMQVTCMLHAHASSYSSHPDNTGVPAITSWTRLHLKEWTRCIQTHQEWRMWEMLIHRCNAMSMSRIELSNMLHFAISSFYRLNDEEISFVRLHLLLLLRSWNAGQTRIPWFFFDQTSLNYVADIVGITDICFLRYAFPYVEDKLDIDYIDSVCRSKFSKDLTKAAWQQEVFGSSLEKQFLACIKKWIVRRQHQLEKMKKVRALLVTDASFMCADVFDYVLSPFLCVFDPLLQNPKNRDHLPMWPRPSEDRVETIRPLFSL